MSTYPKQPKERPHFPKTSDLFYKTIKNNVGSIILKQKNKALRITWIKTIFYPLLFISVYTLLLIKGQNLFVFYACYGSLGLITTIIVFNIVHDAVHNSLFSVPALNKNARLLLDFLGGNSYVWTKRHVVFHHGFTNIPGWDIDIQQSVIVRFNEKQPFRQVHRLQPFYMPLIYLLYSLNWIFRRDFQDFFQRSSVIRTNFTIPKKEYFKMVAFKIFYLFYLVVVPILKLNHPALSFILGIIIMHALMSALTLLVLLPSHLDEDAQFPEPDENLMLPDTWAVHQLKVTNDFATSSKILNFIMGGLNHHIAHHLFPNVNHNIIPKITEHISNTAKVYRLPYKNYSLREIMSSHLKLLSKNSHEIFEE